MAISRHLRHAIAPPKAIGTGQLTFSGQTLVMRCMPGPHDLGGKDFGPVKQSDHVRSEWDNRVDALLKLMLDGHRFRVDELRRAIESLPEREYMSFSYYQKWLAAIRILIVEKGFLSEDEISVRLDQLRQKAPV